MNIKKALENYKAFLNEIEMVKKPKEFAPQLDKFFSSSYSVVDVDYWPTYLISSDNYNNLYNTIIKIQRHLTELFAWINVYKKETNKKDKYVILAEKIGDSLILLTNSIYSFKEKVIYAIVVTSSLYQGYLDEPIKSWKLNEKSERKINLKILKDNFGHIKSIKKLMPKITKIHKQFHTKPLDFRPKSTHRITPGIEKFGGQKYLIGKKSVRYNFGLGETIKLKDIESNVEQFYLDCLDLFYEFENYCVNYLEVKDKIKPVL